MNEMRAIEIDFEVHKLIEMERTSFSETPNEVLRRLLKLGETPQSNEPLPPTGRPWSKEGATLPHGTELKMTLNGRVYTGKIDNGFWLVEGRKYSSPSGAADNTATTKKGKRASLNGWLCWQVKRPGDAEWVELISLRNKTS